MIFGTARKLVATVAASALVITPGCSNGSGRYQSLAPPSFTGPGAAGICLSPKGAIATVTLETDVPNPRCLSVSGQQRLRVLNNFREDMTVQLGKLRLVIAAGGEGSMQESFDRYLQPGGHYMTVSANGRNAYNVEIRYEK